jgi:hypothetical protein
MHPQCKKLLGKPSLEPAPLEEYCRKIDDRVKVIFKDRKRHSNSVFRDHIKYVYTEWIDKNARAAALFPYFKDNEHAILERLIYNEEQRTAVKTLQRIALDNPSALRSLVEDRDLLARRVAELEKSRSELEEANRSLLSQNEALRREIQELKSTRERTMSRWSPESVRERIAANSSVHREIASQVRETFSSFLPDSFDYDRLGAYAEEHCDLIAMQQVGYLGEAAVFRHLRDSHKFRTVKWPNQSSQRTDKRVVSGGEEFFISEVGAAYDIELVTLSGDVRHVEVKSTCWKKSDGRVSHHFSEYQLAMFSKSPPQAVLALVFDARSDDPEIMYFAMDRFREI